MLLLNLNNLKLEEMIFRTLVNNVKDGIIKTDYAMRTPLILTVQPTINHISETPAKQYP